MFACPICGSTSKQYAPWYKPSRGTLATHLYNAHAEELRQRLSNPGDSVIAQMRTAGFKVEARSGTPPIKIVLAKRAARRYGGKPRAYKGP